MKTPTSFKNSYRLGGLGLVMLGLGACQSLPSLTNQATVPTAPPVLLTTKTPANETLALAIKSALRSSFSYRSTVNYSNALHQQALANATPEQLAQGDNPDTHCEHLHDEGYITLAKQAIAEGVDISSDRFIEAREKLKADFLACQNPVVEASDEQTSDDNAEGSDDAAQEYGKYNALAVKKSQLLQDYWLNAIKMDLVGNYRPFKGTLTALPTVQYQSKNINLMLNQPIFVDIHAETLYLWADNFALANATWLDKELGLAWQDKWLAVSLNDGSLPADFTKTLAKELTNARLNGNSGQGLVYLSQAEFDELAGELDDEKRAIVWTANQVIGETHGKAGSLRAFYQSMITAYPVLLERPSDPEKVVLDSKTLMQRAFALIKKRLDKDEAAQTANKQPQAVSYYGLKDGNLVWHYHQNYLSKTDEKHPMQVGVLTKFDETLLASPFARLPVQHQAPTADNRVDLLVYSNQLLEKLKKEDGDVKAQLVARTLLAVLVGFDDLKPAKSDKLADSEFRQDF